MKTTCVVLTTRPFLTSIVWVWGVPLSLSKRMPSLSPYVSWILLWLGRINTIPPGGSNRDTMTPLVHSRSPPSQYPPPNLKVYVLPPGWLRGGRGSRPWSIRQGSCWKTPYFEMCFLTLGTFDQVNWVIVTNPMTLPRAYQLSVWG